MKNVYVLFEYCMFDESNDVIAIFTSKRRAEKAKKYFINNSRRDGNEYNNDYNVIQYTLDQANKLLIRGKHGC